MPRKTSAQPPQRRRGETRGAASGTPADRLIRAWLAEDWDEFEDLAEASIAGGRDGVLQAALRKIAERYEDEAVDDFAVALTEMAEFAEGQGEFDQAELVLLPLLTSGAPPDPAPLAAGLAASGAFATEAEAIFAPGWRTAEAVLALPPGVTRRVLLDIAAGGPPGDLPPPAPEVLDEGGVFVLVGALVYRTEPAGTDPDADPEVQAATEEARGSELAAAFERWRDGLEEAALAGGMLLDPCSPSELADEIQAMAGEEEDAALEEVLDFIETAREEAGDETIAARLAVRGGEAELVLLTAAGRELDRRSFALAEDGLTAEAIRRLVEATVLVLD